MNSHEDVFQEENNQENNLPEASSSQDDILDINQGKALPADISKRLDSVPCIVWQFNTDFKQLNRIVIAVQLSLV